MIVSVLVSRIRTMACFNNFVTVLVLCAFLAVALGQVSQGGGNSPQGGPHQNQGRIRRQVDQGGPQVDQGEPQADQNEANQDQTGNQKTDEDDDDHIDDGLPVWTSCDFGVDPRLSCADCHTRVICKPVGGLIKICRNPFRPYCNYGLCSATPSAECA
ncbi:uncharacterized protein LOC126374111 [Pectinophora gossypiella]|uniref:uncharacterized protein LOC126374111 n=1 Tax=Pectinophora gossypiella TaxID=13191 RepID=UPI00214E5DBD|nr:uncharacterized protein LOC126374111 [Pectinophora gossypiella]